MKKILSILLIAASVVSLTKPSTVHYDYWQLRFNDKIIFSEHSSFEDSIVVLNLKDVKETDTIRYEYHPCMIDDHTTYTAELYLVTPPKKRYKMCVQKSNAYWFGNFSAISIKSAADDCNCDTFLFEQTVGASWINDKGKEKKDKLFTRTMLKIKVIR